ncbi:hypothetical protein B1NLA3E_11960 [Bacillus sp. 1NLA3E]|nr:hypothetical protein B1NLA3E_11960 [Bacillus sp. 1NLA3E]
MIKSINIGKPVSLEFKTRGISSGINKKPVEKPLFLSTLNFSGDEQADLVHHGGKDKAICVYPYEHYVHWEKELKRPLSYGAFGENLTTVGLLEDDICIGDIFKFGEAIVQISQPRQPCYKLSLKYGVEDLPIKIQQTGYTGFYCRVLKEGTVSKELGLTLMHRHPKGITVSYANLIMHHEKGNIEGLNKMLDIDELSESWRATFINRRDGIAVDAERRLLGNDKK